MIYQVFGSLLIAVVGAAAIGGGQAPTRATGERPTPSDYADAAIDRAAVEAANLGSIVLIVARLGAGERDGRLNRRRLQAVRKFVGQRTYMARFYYAEGDPVGGLGRIEIYVGGKLLADPTTTGIILAPKNRLPQLWMPDI